ncbi:MAG: heterodisulfide reductase subunit B [Deltaproteobacteria bacterium RBG_16_54_18]|nr:MAG: heterodisulfide reductase subunit B [Deltaproteobacteria bacterium RBG_16_54_18]
MKAKRYAYYPGCSQHGTAAEYEVSARAVADKLGITLVEVEDWSCCGSTPAHTVDHVLYGALAARNLALAEQMKLDTMVTPCPSCLIALKSARVMAQDKEHLQELRELIDLPLKGTIEVKSLLQVIFEDIGLEALTAKVKQPLTGLTFAPYYGCILTRPPQLAQFDDAENPVSMDKIIAAVGANAPDFPFKTECCGAAFGLAKRQIVQTLSAKVLAAAEAIAADAIVVACPLCHQNLDLRQEQVNAFRGARSRMPVWYITQVVGLALGFSPHEMGLDKHAVASDAILAKWETHLKEHAQ